ncbi:MAG: hypothetical protein NTX63_04190 [Candidatus Peregrinibacteria bacterium]|nr:hypothetical protein [Candidatus Peregrinibacteria bacterium]
MRTSSLLVAAALSLSGCATDQLEGSNVTLATKSTGNGGRRILPFQRDNEPKIEKPDPCISLIKDPSFKSFYLKWRGLMKDILKDTTPALPELHDSSAPMCEMTTVDKNITTKIHSFFGADGQFVGHIIRPEKPNNSFRISLETTFGGIDGKQNPAPDLGQVDNDPNQCAALKIDVWKEWERLIPLSPDHVPGAVPTIGQIHEDTVYLPCDPTAPAMIGGYGCGYEAPSPENGNQLVDGCGGGGDFLDRNEVTALIQCLQNEMKIVAKEMCL